MKRWRTSCAVRGEQPVPPPRAQHSRWPASLERRKCLPLDRKKSTRKTKIDERLRHHALFVAFAPVEDPQISVAVLVENGGGGSYHRRTGGQSCARRLV